MSELPAEPLALGRHGLPLPGSAVPGQPRAAWLPAGARNRVAPSATRGPVLRQLPEAGPPGDDEEAAWTAEVPAPADSLATDAWQHADEVTAGLSVAPDPVPGDVPAVQTTRDAADVRALKTAEPLEAPALRRAAAQKPAASRQAEAVAGAGAAYRAASGERPAAKGQAIGSEAGAVPAGVSPLAAQPAAAAREPVLGAQRPAPPQAAAPRSVRDGIPPPVGAGGAARDVHVSAAAAVPASAEAPPLVPRTSSGGAAPVAPMSIEPARDKPLPRPEVRHNPGVQPLPRPAMQPNMQSMGLPQMPASAAGASGAALPAAADLALLLAPAPAPQRAVVIDRVAVTVQAPPASPSPTAPQAPMAAPTRAAAPPRPGFRNPWASYHARRD